MNSLEDSKGENKCKKKYGTLVYLQVMCSLQSLRNRLENRKKLKKIESRVKERKLYRAQKSFCC